MELKQYIKNYLSNLYKTEEGSMILHPGFPELRFIVHIGLFKSVETFYIPEWTIYLENGTIYQELAKRVEFIEFKFKQAGYTHEDGGMGTTFFGGTLKPKK